MKNHIKLYEEFTNDFPMENGVYITEEGIRNWIDKNCDIWAGGKYKYVILESLNVIFSGSVRFSNVDGRIPFNIRECQGERFELYGPNTSLPSGNNDLTSLKGFPTVNTYGCQYYLKGNGNLTTLDYVPLYFNYLGLDDCGITHIDKKFFEGNKNNISLKNNKITDVSFLDGRFSSVYLNGNLIEDVTNVPEDVDFVYLNGNQIYTLLGAKRYFLLHTLAGNPCKKAYELSGYNEKTWNYPEVHAKAMVMMPRKYRPKIHEKLKDFAKENWTEYKQMVDAVPELQTMYPIQSEALDAIKMSKDVEGDFY